MRECAIGDVCLLVGYGAVGAIKDPPVLGARGDPTPCVGVQVQLLDGVVRIVVGGLLGPRVDVHTQSILLDGRNPALDLVGGDGQVDIIG